MHSVEKLVIVLLVLIFVSAPVMADNSPNAYDSNGAFLFLNTNTFSSTVNPKVSVFCDKDEINWPNGCPGPDVNVDASLDDPVPTDEATISFCGSTYPAKIVADDNPSTMDPAYRVYDPMMGGDTAIDAGCPISYRDQGTSEIEFRTTEEYGAKCGLLNDVTCSKTGGEVFVTTAAAGTLSVGMNTGAAVWGPGGEIADLNNWKLTYETDSDGNVRRAIRIEEYDTLNVGGKVVDFKTPKKNYVLDYTTSGTNINDFIVDSESYDQSCKDDGKDQPCDVALVDMTENNDDVATDRCAGVKGRCPLGYDPLDRDVEYNLQGENNVEATLVYGKYYSGVPYETNNNEQFFLCSEYLDSTHGRTVYSPGDNYEFDQFKCSSNGIWENVAACDDGLDNDEDGATDLNDPNCDGSNDDSEQVVPSDCSPQIGLRDGVKTVFSNSWGSDYTPDGSECTYLDIDGTLDWYTRTDSIFTCNQDGTITGYSGPTDNQASSYCTEISSVYDDGTWDAHGGAMPVAEYFADKGDMPLSEDHPDTAEKFIKPDPDDPTGLRKSFKNKFYQDLHSAEQKYGELQEVSADNTPNTLLAYSNTYLSTYHNNDTYTARGLTDLEDGYNEGEYLDSWSTEDVGSTNFNDKITSIGQDAGSDGYFPGGFAGKCPEGQKWQYDYGNLKWSCSGDIPWTQAIVGPDYTLKEGPQTVGLYITPHNFQTGLHLRENTGINDLNSFSQAFSNANNEDVDLTSVTGVCWVGDKNNKPAFEDANEGNTWFETQVTGLENRPDKPVPLFGQLDIGEDDWTCTWGYDTSNNEFYSGIGGPADPIQSSSDTRLMDDWFGDGISRSGFDSVISADAKNQFNTWMDQNSGTSRSNDVSDYYYNNDHLALN